MALPSAHACGICGAPNAPWGYRLPGLLSDLPPGKRSYLWACTDHRPEAAARQQAATIITKHEV